MLAPMNDAAVESCWLLVLFVSAVSRSSVDCNWAIAEICDSRSWLLIGFVGSWFSSSAISICMKAPVVRLLNPSLPELELVLDVDAVFEVDETVLIRTSLPGRF